MFHLQGYCPNCPCWFVIAERTLAAHRLCPCCLTPAQRTLRAPAAVLRALLRLRRAAGATA